MKFKSVLFASAILMAASSLTPAAADDPTRHNTAGHKRCRNSALHGSGYQLIYPDYKTGYGALLAAR